MSRRVGSPFVMLGLVVVIAGCQGNSEHRRVDDEKSEQQTPLQFRLAQVEILAHLRRRDNGAGVQPQFFRKDLFTHHPCRRPHFF